MAEGDAGSDWLRLFRRVWITVPIIRENRDAGGTTGVTEMPHHGANGFTAHLRAARIILPAHPAELSYR
jgi:hypothetical protein